MSGRERRAVSARQLLFGSIALGLVIVIGAVLAYFRFIHYRRVAAFHVPKTATFAARVDLEKVILFEPFRKHLLPLLNERPGGAANAKATSRSQRFEEKTGINLGRDIREVLLAYSAGSPGSEGHWLLAMGGIFPEDGVVEAVHQLLQDEGMRDLKLASDGLLERAGPFGFALAQSDDGLLILAEDRNQVRDALVGSSRYLELGLKPEGALGFGAQPEAVVTQLPGLLGFGFAGLRALHGEARLAEPLEVELVLEPVSAAQVGSLAARAKQAISMLQSLATLTPGPDWAGERGVLARAEVRVVEPSEVHVTSTWEQVDLDRGAKSLALWLRATVLSDPDTGN